MEILKWVVAIVLASQLILGCRPVGMSAPHGASFGRYWDVPQFGLIDEMGRGFNREHLLGKIWIVDFFYSSCPGPCPMLSSRVRDLHRRLKGETGVGFLSITSDPERDTPEVLRKYAQKFGADERWKFLTGKKPEIYGLANDGFKLSLTDTPGGEEPVTHSTRLVLVDRSGCVRGFYEGVGEGSDDASNRLLADVKRLIKEER